MLRLSDLGSKNSCLESIGMDFVESWNLKILVAEKILIKRGDFKSVDEIKRVQDIYEGDENVGISGTTKSGWLRPTEKFSINVPLDEFNETLNSSFPLSGNDLMRFNEIKAKYKRYLG